MAPQLMSNLNNQYILTGDPSMCPHEPKCPSFEAPDRDAASILAAHPVQGWSLLCNGVIVFEDTGELLPDGRCVDPCRPEPAHAAA
nr:DUF5999 family protein [Cryptosporangium arvum]